MMPRACAAVRSSLFADGSTRSERGAKQMSRPQKDGQATPDASKCSGQDAHLALTMAAIMARAFPCDRKTIPEGAEVLAKTRQVVPSSTEFWIWSLRQKSYSSMRKKAYRGTDG